MFRAAWIAAFAAGLSTTAAHAQTETAPKSLLQALSLSPAGPATPAEDDRIDPDRPHLPEATTAVGLGRAVLESGYTYTEKSGALLSNSYPEALMRVGAFADWFEFRVGQNYLSEQRTIAGQSRTSAGAQDLYLGVKIALTEQHGLIPSTALIPQMTVPTGSSAVTAGRVLPGLNADFGWEVVKDRFGIELLVGNNEIQDELGGFQHQLATGLTGIFHLSKQLELFTEWDAFYVSGGLASTLPQHYVVGGLVYFITPDIAVDARAGVGLSHNSNDMLAGVGLSVRR